MPVLRILAGALILSALACSTPASAQFYFKSKDVRGAPVKGDEPGIAQPLPGATDAEIRANLLWTMRSGLNVAALQCQFEPTLLTVSNYNYLLKDHAAGQSYMFTGPVTIHLEPAEDLTTGRFRVRSKAVARVSQAGPDPTDTQVRRATATLEINGERLPLTPPGIVVGRGNDADLRVNDPGVSRRHAEFRVTEDAHGPRVTVHDLGSTNGVYVNGHKVPKKTLEPGDIIRVGNTEAIFKRE